MRKSKRNDRNFNPKKVIYEGEIYLTGNRKDNLIELFKEKEFYKVVLMSEVEPITDFQIKLRAIMIVFKGKIRHYWKYATSKNYRTYCKFKGFILPVVVAFAGLYVVTELLKSSSEKPDKKEEPEKPAEL
jgi:hypothetical protein